MNWYVAISYGYWGRGRTIAEAKRELRKAGGGLKTFLVYGFDEPEGSDGPTVNGDGCTVSHSRRKLVEAVKNGKAIRDLETVKA